MKIPCLDGVREIRLETALGHRPIEIYEMSVHDDVLTISIDECLDVTLPSSDFEAKEDDRASREFGDPDEATIL